MFGLGNNNTDDQNEQNNSGSAGSSEEKPAKEVVQRKFKVHVHVGFDVEVIATDRRNAIEKVKEIQLGERIGRDNATVIYIEDLPKQVE